MTLRNFSFIAKSKARWGGGLAFRFRTCSQWHRKPDFPQGQRVDHSLMKKGFEREESGVPFIVPINAQTHHRLLSSYCQMYLPPPLYHLGLILIPNLRDRTATVLTKGRSDYLSSNINICMESLKYVVFPRVRL